MSLEITIDSELESLIAPLAAQEFDLLKAQILQHGCLQPLCIWKTEEKQRILLDGHNRYRICAEYNLAFNTINVRLASRDHAKLWILEHQAGRRNLTDDQRAIVWNELREQRSKLIRAENLQVARATKAGLSVAVKTPATGQRKDTRLEIAKEARLSESKLRRAQKLKKYLPGLYAQVLRGQITLRDGLRQFPVKTEARKDRDYFRRVTRQLDGVYKGKLAELLRGLCHLEPRDLNPTTEEGVLQVIAFLNDVSERSDNYANELKDILTSHGKTNAA